MLRAILSAAALSAAVTAQTFNDGAPAGDYESYVYALEWQPQWSQPPDCSPTLAAHLSPTSYAANHLSSHGLWPNYDPSLHDGMSWPQFCTRTDGAGLQYETYTDCEANYSSHAYCTPSVATLEKNTTQHWQKYALEYSWSDLASHEWSKHGSCTPWLSGEYFAYVEQMYYRVASGGGANLITNNVGKTVSKADLSAAFSKDLGGATAVFNCDASCNLSEVWTAWALDPVSFAPMDAIDYSEAEPCPSTCESLFIIPWNPTDGGCPPTPAPAPNNATSCEPSQHGPVCTRDLDCQRVASCVRCASSGYCTSTPL